MNIINLGKKKKKVLQKDFKIAHLFCGQNQKTQTFYIVHIHIGNIYVWNLMVVIKNSLHISINYKATTQTCRSTVSVWFLKSQ